MNEKNQIEDIKLELEEVRRAKTEKTSEYKTLLKAKENMELKISKQMILNEIAGEKIGGISEYYYNKVKEMELETEEISLDIKEIKSEENRILTLLQKLINQSKNSNESNKKTIAAPQIIRGKKRKNYVKY